MTKTSTQNDLIRYLYNETCSEENVAIEQQLLIDDEFRDRYYEMLGVTTALSALACEPGDRVIDAVLSYSKNRNLHSV